MTAPRTLPQAVLFDWDNTLVDSWACIHASLNVTLEAMGHAPWSLDATRGQVRRSLRESFPILFGARWEEARALYYDHFSAHHLDRLTPLPGAEALLESLASRGVYLAVVSNKTGHFLRRECSALGWDHYFGCIVGATDAAADKPALAPVTMALAPAGIRPPPPLSPPALSPDLTAPKGGSPEAIRPEAIWPEAIWFVGDADIDMECAHGAGCLPVLVGNCGESDFTRYPPAYHYAHCFALCDLVRQLDAPISPGGLRKTDSPL